MRLLPRTLFWRHALVITVLLITAQLLTVYLIDLTLARSRAAGLAVLEADRARLVFSAHARLPAAERQAYRDELLREHGIRLSTDPREFMRSVPDARFVAALAQGVRQHMGSGSEVAVGAPGLPRGLWIKAPRQEWWIFIPNEPVGAGFPWEWVASVALALAFAFGGAMLLVWRVNRPLYRLAAAARDLGQGRAVMPVLHEGPAEIRGLSTQFNQMVEDLRHVEDERNLLLAGISHDLRTPLTRLRLGLEMLGDQAGAAKASLIVEVETINAILEQFLVLGQGGRELPSEWGNLNELVQDTAERYGAGCTPPVLKLAELPMLRFHSLALQRLLANLLNNAYRHGGGQVEIETSRCADGQVRINIRDRGPGLGRDLPGEALMSIASASLRTGNRHGLGLAIVQRMAQLHNGRLALHSRPGGGLDAEVDLPLEQS